MGDDQLTTTDIAQHLPDVAQATLYRQISVLVEAGVLAVVAERRVRGSVERTYALASGAASLGPEDAAAMTTDEHMRGFITFVASLIDEFARYLGDASAKPAEDTVGYRQIALWIDDAERDRLAEGLGAVLERYREHEPKGERTRVLLNTILIPDLVATVQARDQDDS
jgi:hypothetical protein